MIFGDNTYLSYAGLPINTVKGGEFKVAFSFVMPIMPQGDYTFWLLLPAAHSITGCMML